MYRRFAALVAIALLLLAAQRGAAYFDQVVGHRFEDDGDISVVTEECGRTWNILIGDGSDLDGKGANFSEDCVRAARTRAAEAVGLGIIAALVVVWVVWIEPKVRRIPIHEVVRKLSDGAVEVTGRDRSRSGVRGGSLDQHLD